MRKGTLARLEINLGVLVLVGLIVLAGYSLVAGLADRLDPKVRDCVAQREREATTAGKVMAHDYAVELCKRLEAVGALH